MKIHSFGKQLTVLSFLCLLLVLAQSVHADDPIIWRPVTPEELQMKTPKVEADADAEAIFWEVRIDDKKSTKISYDHYVRVKIFTERGREKFSKFDIPFYKGKKVENVAARVIKPDGSIINLAPTDIFEREIVRANKVKIKAKSFAVPGIEPGVIVEYQYSESVKNDSAGGERLIYQRDIPMQKVVYYVRPFKGSKLNFTPFNMKDVKFTESQDRFMVGTMTNVPSLKEEPYMPPEDQVRSWTLLSYAPFNIDNQFLGSMLSWNFYANNFRAYQNWMIKPDKEVKKLADQLTANTASDEEKLKKIYHHVQSQIRNLAYDTTITEEERENVDIVRPKDIIKERMARPFLINLFFGAIASSAGFDVRLYCSSNRSEIFFNPDKVANRSFLHNAGIAVKVDEKWKFFDPGTPYLAYGDTFWHDQGTTGMLIDSIGYGWVTSPHESYSKSVSKRTGKFKLLEDGALEGEMKFEYSGNQAISRREGGFQDSPSKREEDAKNEIKQRMSEAEISNVSIENFSDSSKPLTFIYKVRVPNYAQKTGKRLFVQPGVFEYGSGAVFSSATRIHNIYFPYPWSEQDEIEIELPANFAADGIDAPRDIADTGKISGLKITLEHDKAKNVLRYKRNFHFGAGDRILFENSAYQPLKTLFDSFHKADTHTITLKQKDN